MVRPSSLVTLAVTALAAQAAAQSTSTSGSSSSSLFSDIPLCSQTELVEVADLMTTNADKLACQKKLDVTEMFKVSDPLELCDVPVCVAALQELYSTLPQCRYQDWPIQYEAEMLLKNCGITPVNITESSSSGSYYLTSLTGSDSGSEDSVTTPAANWNVSSSDSSTDFAPVGVTPTPTPTTTPETGSSSSSSASSVVASVMLSVVTASAVASLV